MVIRNNGQNATQIESANATALISYSDTIEVKIEGENISFNKPGEYEYKGIEITAREITEGEYKGISNITRVAADGVRVLFLLEGLEAKQEDLESILDIDILVIREKLLEKLDRLVMLYNPKKVVIIQSELKESPIIESITKLFSTAQISTDKQLKPKQDEFQSENFMISFSILKK